MSRPQQPELARSAKTDLDPDHIETGLQGQPKPKSRGETGPVPPANEPGHHPLKEQDKPDLDAFAAKLGTDPKAPGATSARKGKAAPPKATPAKTGPAKAASTAKPAKAATRPAAPAQKKSPAAPPRVEATPTKRPAAAPAPRPQSAPTPREAAQVSAPQPEPEGEPDPRLVGRMLMPLRQTVKRLEQLDRTLSARLTKKSQWVKGGLGPRGR